MKHQIYSSQFQIFYSKIFNLVITVWQKSIMLLFTMPYPFYYSCSVVMTTESNCLPRWSKLVQATKIWSTFSIEDIVSENNFHVPLIY